MNRIGTTQRTTNVPCVVDTTGIGSAVTIRNHLKGTYDIRILSATTIAISEKDCPRKRGNGNPALRGQ